MRKILHGRPSIGFQCVLEKSEEDSDQKLILVKVGKIAASHPVPAIS